jgi:ribosomal protein S18 acetylase RimI-like enzyme
VGWAIGRSIRKRAAAAIDYAGVGHAVRRVAQGSWAGTYLMRARDVGRGTPSPGALPPEPDLGLLAKSEIDAYLWFRALARRSDVLGRLEAGHTCIVVRLDLQIVSTVWLRYDEIWLPVIGRAVPLGDREAYAYDAYTDPAYRRHGVGIHRSLAINEHLRARDVRTSFAYVRSENAPALRASAEFGYEPAGRVRWFKAGPIELVRASLSDGPLADRRLVRAPSEL